MSDHESEYVDAVVESQTINQLIDFGKVALCDDRTASQPREAFKRSLIFEEVTSRSGLNIVRAVARALANDDSEIVRKNSLEYATGLLINKDNDGFIDICEGMALTSDEVKDALSGQAAYALHMCTKLSIEQKMRLSKIILSCVTNTETTDEVEETEHGYISDLSIAEQIEEVEKMLLIAEQNRQYAGAYADTGLKEINRRINAVIESSDTDLALELIMTAADLHSETRRTLYSNMLVRAYEIDESAYDILIDYLMDLGSKKYIGTAIYAHGDVIEKHGESWDLDTLAKQTARFTEIRKIYDKLPNDD